MSKKHKRVRKTLSFDFDLVGFQVISETVHCFFARR